MKKILCFVMLFVCASYMPAKAETTTTTANNWTTQAGYERVVKIGTNLLQKNGLPTQIKFTVIETDEINAFASGENEICVYTGLLKFVDTDDELAGVIAHEIGHILNHHVAKQSLATTALMTSIAYGTSNMSELAQAGAAVAGKLSMLKLSRTEEYEADVTGVDLIKNAGYHPLAMVSVLYKIGGNYVDFIQTHPSCDKRTMYSYNYIAYAYPEKAKEIYDTQSYKQFLNYAAPIIQAREANPRKVASFKKSQAKLLAKRLKKMEAYKKKNNGSIWAGSYNAMKTLYSIGASLAGE